MSHFSVGVILKNKYNLEDVLELYDENNEDMFTEYEYETKEEYIESFKRYNPNTELSDEQIWPAKALEEYGERDVNLDEEVIYGRCNLDARWDWWQIGGRWNNSLTILKDSITEDTINPVTENTTIKPSKYTKCDGALIKDIKWKYMNKVSQAEREKYTEFWNDYVLEKNKVVEYDTLYNPKYYLDRYGTLENYIKSMRTFYTHDLLLCDEDNDPEWLTMGDMGWFGCDGATQDSIKEYMEKFYSIINNEKYQDYYFIVVDCHI